MNVGLFHSRGCEGYTKEVGNWTTKYKAQHGSRKPDCEGDTAWKPDCEGDTAWKPDCEGDTAWKPDCEGDTAWKPETGL